MIVVFLCFRHAGVVISRRTEDLIKIPRIKKCPYCGQEALEPSRARHLSEAVVNLMPIMRYYRCHHCNWRGRLFSLHAHSAAPTSNHIVFYTVIFIMAALLTLYVRFEVLP